MNKYRMREDLRALLYEAFRSAFLHRLAHGDKYTGTPNTMIESVANVFLAELPHTRREISKIIDRHAIEGIRLRSPTHSDYTPAVLKRMVVGIGREAWKHRYDGPLEAELKVQESQVTLYQISHHDHMPFVHA